MTEVTKNGMQRISFTLPNLGAISSIIGVLVFLAGWISSYMVFSASLKSLSEGNARLQERVNSMSKGQAEDRQAFRDRLTGLDADIKYMTRDMAEIKLAVVPKR